MLCRFPGLQDKSCTFEKVLKDFQINAEQQLFKAQNLNLHRNSYIENIVYQNNNK